MRWQVQNGENIKFWEDKWIPSLSGFKMVSHKPINCGIEWVSDVINKNRGVWEEDKLRQVVSEQEWQTIISIPIPMLEREDSLVWHFSKNGDYSVKSGNCFVFQERVCKRDSQPLASFMSNKNLWDVIWKLEVPHKVRHFLVESV